jgi:hypothetical protein
MLIYKNKHVFGICSTKQMIVVRYKYGLPNRI